MSDEKVKPEDQFEDVSVGITDPTKNKLVRKIVVDRQGCIGARSCVLVAPGAFQMDDQDLAYVPGDKSAYEDDKTLIMGAESCPVLAIHLYDDNDKKIFPQE